LKGLVWSDSPGARRRRTKFVTIKELAEAFQRLYGCEVRHDFPRSGDFMGVRTCSKKASEVLGWTCKTSLDDGIQSYVNESVTK